MEEGLKAVGAKIHGCFYERPRIASESCDSIVVNDNDAECGVPQDDRPERKRYICDVEGRSQGNTCDNPGKCDR